MIYDLILQVLTHVCGDGYGEGEIIAVQKTYLRLLGVAKKYWVAFLIGMVATVILSLTDAGFAYLIQPIVNKGFIHRDSVFIRGLPIIIILLFLVRSLASFCSTYYVTSVARNVVMDFRRLLFGRLMELPASFYDCHPSGKLLSTVVYNVEQVAQASSDVLITILRETSLMVGLVGVMFALNWRLASVFLVITPLIGWGLNICSRRLRQLSGRVQASVGTVSHLLKESIEAYKVIRIFGGQAYETQKFARATQVNCQQELKIQVTNGIGAAIIQLIVSLPLALVLYMATTPSWGISAGSFAAIISAMIMIIRPVRRVTELNNFIQKGLAGAHSIFALLDEPTEQNTGMFAVPRVQGHIVFQNLCFTYPGAERPVLHHIDLSIHAGQTVAIVGYSGSGKSTLVSLLPRFYEISSGRILIDDVDISTYRLDSLRRQFSLVSQHTVLFNDTIARNIAYAEEGEIDYHKLLHAAQAANAYEFIEKLPQGFDAVVGEQGLLLSGGQRQRIAIARALYKKAPILILDEATSALDTHSERLIQGALLNLMSQCTTLVIAHRLSTIEHADWILVMDNGEVVDKGTHAELLTRGGVYAELHRMQFNEMRPAED